MIYFRRGYHTEGHHDSIGIFFPYFGDEQSAHAGTSATTQRMRKLESLEAIAALSLFADNIEDRVDELGTLGVVTLGPVVTCATLSEHEVVRTEYLAKRPRTDRVHRPRL